MYRMMLFRLLQNSSITCVKFSDLLVNWNLLVNSLEHSRIWLYVFSSAVSTGIWCWRKTTLFQKSLHDVVPSWFSRFLLLYRLQNITGISCCPSMMSPEILIFMTKHLFSLFFSSYKNCFHLFSIIYLGWTDVSGFFFFLSLWSLSWLSQLPIPNFF